MSTLKTNNIQHVDRSDPSIIINTDGSVNIAGTMTYEDVTNVDAVGIITGRNNIDAQKQVHVGTGVSVKAGGLNVTAGITTVQALQATTGTFSAAVSGTTGTFTGDVDIADKIVHTGDTNTTIRFPAADTVTVETGGSERFRIDSSGFMGLGTNSPTDTGGYGQALDITGGSGGAAIYLRSSNGDTGQIALGSADLTIRTRQADPILFSTNNSERVRITPDGDMGVGTSDIWARLVSREDSTNTSLTGHNYLASQSGIAIDNGSNTTGSFNAYTSRVKNAGGTQQSGSIAFKSTSSGYAPEIHLTQRNGSGSQRSSISIASDGTTTASGTSDGVLQLTTTDSRGAFIRFGQGGSYHNMVGCADGLTNGDKEDLGIRAADNIIFAAGGSTERFRITADGGIGIGNQSPTTWGGGIPTIEFKGTSGSYTARAGAIAFESQSGSNGYNVLFSEGGNLLFYSGATDRASAAERLRITSNGDVLIGATSEITDTKVVISGNINQYNSDTGTGASTKSYVLGRAYTMSTSSTDLLTFDNWGTSAFEITVFRRDNSSPAGANVTKIYLAFHGSGTAITQASIAQESKVTRGSIHTTTFGISENNNTATLSVTGDDNGGETQDFTFHIIGRGNSAGTIVVA